MTGRYELQFLGRVESIKQRKNQNGYTINNSDKINVYDFIAFTEDTSILSVELIKVFVIFAFIYIP